MRGCGPAAGTGRTGLPDRWHCLGQAGVEPGVAVQQIIGENERHVPVARVSIQVLFWLGGVPDSATTAGKRGRGAQILVGPTCMWMWSWCAWRRFPPGSST